MLTGTRHEACDCPRAVHVHGSRTTYVVHGCRCDACREDNRVAASRRNRAKLYGRYDRFINGDVVRSHLRNLMAQGMGWKRIAAAAGLSASTVYPILYGKHRDKPDHPEHRPPRLKVQRDVAEKLLAVELDLAGGAFIDATGTRRRVQALVARGWSMSRLSEALGIHRGNFHLHTDTLTTVATRKAVKRLYDQWWNTDPPVRTRGERTSVTKALRYAQKRRWARPMDWDDDTIDDPTAAPSTTPNGPGRLGVHRDDILFLLDEFDTLDAMAARLGIKRSSLLRQMERHNIPVPNRMRVLADDLASTRRRPHAA